MKRPDKKNAASLCNAAEKEMRFTLKLELNEDSASTIVRNIYENFRRLGDALLAIKGLESTDHLQPINQLREAKVDTPRPLNYLETLRKFRHNINYYGYQPSTSEAEDVQDFARKCFKPLLNHIRSTVNT